MYHLDGRIERKDDLCDCTCIIGNFSDCRHEGIVAVNKAVEEDNEDEEKEDDEEKEGDEDTELWNVVLSGSVIALWTPNEVKESFYLCVVDQLLIANGNDLMHITTVLEEKQWLEDCAMFFLQLP